jgi:hypothetical protein
MKKIIYIAAAILVCCSCEEVINLDLPVRNQRLVIEGLITNAAGPYFVKLSRTTRYNYVYDPSTIEYEKGARVILFDDLGNTDTLSEVSQGIYQSHTSIIIGIIGRSFSVDIKTLDGKHYRSDFEEMPDVPAIDSIYFERDTSNRSPDNPAYYLYDIYVDWHDPADVNNYYLRSMSYFWDNQWHDNVQWNWVFDDKYFNGRFIEKDLVNEAYGGYNWMFRISQYSLTEKAYQFWLLVHQQTMGADNDYSNTSVPLIGNVYNVDNSNDYALGYFQVSAKTTRDIFINY